MSSWLSHAARVSLCLRVRRAPGGCPVVEMWKGASAGTTTWATLSAARVSIACAGFRSGIDGAPLVPGASATPGAPRRAVARGRQRRWRVARQRVAGEAGGGLGGDDGLRALLSPRWTLRPRLPVAPDIALGN